MIPFHIAGLPRIITHPQGLKDVAVRGELVKSTRTVPPPQWQWKPAEEEGGSEEWHPQFVEPPIVTVQPEELKDAVRGKFAKFEIQAIGTEPLNYQWEWKSKKKWGWGGKWQPCPAEWSDGATLTIPSVQKSNEGSYRCVISNCAGTQTSKSAKLVS